MVSLIATGLILPTWLIFGVANATHAKASNPLIEIFTISNEYFSPNGDGVKDATEIELKFSEQVKVSLDVFDSTNNLVEHIYDSTGVIDPKTKIWDGKKDDNTAFPDGRYLATITINEGLGDEAVESVEVYVDNSLTGSVAYSTLEPTSGPVVATLSSVSDPVLTVVNNEGKKDYTFVKNASFTFVFEDLAGNKKELVASVNNIENVLPYLNDVAFKSIKDSVESKLILIDGSYSLVIDGNPVSNYAIDFDGTTVSENLAGMGGLKLVDSTITAEDLEAYYKARFTDHSLEPFLNYLIEGAKGLNPFVYVKNDAGKATLVDAAKYNLIPKSEPMVIPGDYPAGEYTLQGQIEDLAGNETTLEFKLSVKKAITTIVLDTEVGKTYRLEKSNYNDIVVVATTSGLLDFSELFEGDSNVARTNGSIMISSHLISGKVDVFIPENTMISGPDDWDGKISTPSIEKLLGLNLPKQEGAYSNIDLVVFMGLEEGSIHFSNPVEIIFRGMAGKSVGIVVNGEFSEITETCDMNMSEEANECKLDSADGKDLIVLTNHFSKFVTYGQKMLTAPEFNVSQIEEPGVRSIVVNWTGNGADYYQVFLNGQIKTIKAASGNDAGVAYTEKFDGVNYGDYSIYMRAQIGDTYSNNSPFKLVSFKEPVVAAVPVITTAVQVTQTTGSPAVANNPKPAEQKIEDNSDEDGKIKGESDPVDTQDEDNKVNWTPWIVLFILILLAGVATGGYFYWFNGEEEVQTTVKEVKEAKEEIIKPQVAAAPVTQIKKKNNNSNKKQKRW